MSLPRGASLYDLVSLRLVSRHGQDAKAVLENVAQDVAAVNHFGFENGRQLGPRDMWWKGPFEAGDASLVLVVNPGWVMPEAMVEEGLDHAFHEPSQLARDCEGLADEWKKEYVNRRRAEEGAPSPSVTAHQYGLAGSWCLLVVVAPATTPVLDPSAIVAALERNRPFSRPSHAHDEPLDTNQIIDADADYINQ